MINISLFSKACLSVIAGDEMETLTYLGRRSGPSFASFRCRLASLVEVFPDLSHEGGTPKCTPRGARCSPRLLDLCRCPSRCWKALGRRIYPPSVARIESWEVEKGKVAPYVVKESKFEVNSALLSKADITPISRTTKVKGGLPLLQDITEVSRQSVGLWWT